MASKPRSARDDLRIAHPCPLQPVEDRREAGLVGIVREDLALVRHGGSERQRLAAGTGAIVEHLHAWRGGGERGGHLRALVLHLEPALLESGFDLHVRVAPCPLDRRDAQAERRDGRRLCAGRLQLGKHALAVGLQRVDAHVERRAGGERRGFGDPIVAEGLAQERLAPVGTVGLNQRGRVSEFVLRQSRCLIGGGRFGREAVAFDGGSDVGGGHAVFERQRAKRHAARRVGAREPTGRAFASQRIVDDVADGRSVAGAGETMRQAPILQRLGRRPVAGLHVGQNLDGCCQPAAQTHVVFL